MVRRPAAAALIALCLLAATGCGGEDEPAATPAVVETPAPTPKGGPVPLGCEHAVPEEPVDTPRGLVSPGRGRIIVSSAVPRTDNPDILIVEGYIERLPDQVQADFDRARGVKVLLTESEQIEAEILVSDGRHRNFWKVTRTCFAASRFTALVADERAGGGVGGPAHGRKPRKRSS